MKTMDFNDFKIYMFNCFAMVVAFSEADAFLKFCLTAVVIGYTGHKWYLMYDDRRNKKDKDEEDN